jgi:CRISPR/Cas system-associated exonuclease Cas4 (RecB family)
MDTITIRPSDNAIAELPDYLPISMLNAFEYCPRRFWIEFVNAEMEINAHVLEGQIRHERAHAVGHGNAKHARKWEDWGAPSTRRMNAPNSD